MDSSIKVKDFKKILSTITDPSTQDPGDEGGKCHPYPSKLGLGLRAPFPLAALPSPSDRTVTHKLDFSDESALLSNSTAMEITACTPSPLAGAKRKVDQERLLMEGELTS